MGHGNPPRYEGEAAPGHQVSEGAPGGPMNQKLANATALYLEGIRDGRVRDAVEAYAGDRYSLRR
jgi:hypothetical protein